MKRIRRCCIALLAVTASFASVEAARAQEASHFAVEGYVFDAKTRKPLANVYTTYFAMFANGTGFGTDGFTDANGFFQIESELPPLSPVRATVSAVCRTKKGDQRYEIPMYATVRTEVYRRDLYVTLPRGVSRCNP